MRPVVCVGRKRLFSSAGLVCIMLAFGLLLWARLILVTGHPRTATAEDAVASAQHEAEPAREVAVGGTRP